MTWADFYLICFALGFAFSLLSFVLGGVHWHLPHGWGGHAAPPSGAGHGVHPHIGHGPHASYFNPVTLAAFLAWFGGTGYLLSRFSAVWFGLGLLIAIVTGLIGAGIIYLFLSKVLSAKDENLDPADFEMVGVLGHLSMPIRESGTGELIYSQEGTRRVAGARSENGAAIAKGIEVMVTRYEKGIAYVRPFEDVVAEMEGKAKPQISGPREK